MYIGIICNFPTGETSYLGVHLAFETVVAMLEPTDF